MGCALKKEEDQGGILMDSSKKKIVFIGLENSGKTSILYKILNQEMINSKNLTACVNIENFKFKKQELLLFDLSGKANKLWGHYFNNLDGLIFVIDASNTSLYQQAQSEINQLIDMINFQNIPLLIYLNKFDIMENYDQNIDLELLNENLEVDTVIQKCSAKTGIGINEGLNKLMIIVENRKNGNSENDYGRNVLQSLQTQK